MIQNMSSSDKKYQKDCCPGTDWGGVGVEGEGGSGVGGPYWFSLMESIYFRELLLNALYRVYQEEHELNLNPFYICLLTEIIDASKGK